MFKFTEGACVAIKEDKPAFGLSAGATGTVWALYDCNPPAYEVTFCAPDGDEFDALMHEDELIEPENSGKSRLHGGNQSTHSA